MLRNCECETMVAQWIFNNHLPLQQKALGIEQEMAKVSDDSDYIHEIFEMVSPR